MKLKNNLWLSLGAFLLTGGISMMTLNLTASAQDAFSLQILTDSNKGETIDNGQPTTPSGAEINNDQPTTPSTETGSENNPEKPLLLNNVESQDPSTCLGKEVIPSTESLETEDVETNVCLQNPITSPIENGVTDGNSENPAPIPMKK